MTLSATTINFRRAAVFEQLLSDRQTYVCRMPRDIVDLIVPLIWDHELPSLDDKNVIYLDLTHRKLSSKDNSYQRLEDYLYDVKVLLEFNRDILRCPLFNIICFKSNNTGYTISKQDYQSLLNLFKKSIDFTRTIVDKMPYSLEEISNHCSRYNQNPFIIERFTLTSKIIREYKRVKIEEPQIIPEMFFEDVTSLLKDRSLSLN